MDFEIVSYSDPTSTDYNFDIVIQDFSKNVRSSYGNRADFIIEGDLEILSSLFDVLIYTNGSNYENKGFVSVLFLENKNSHLSGDIVSFTFLCFISIIDTGGLSRFPQSFIVSRTERDEAKCNYPFGFERFVSCSTLINNFDEFTFNDKLTIRFDISLTEYFNVNSVHSMNVFLAMSCDDSIVSIKEMDGTTTYKLPFATPLFRYLYVQSRYFQCLAKTPMKEAITESVIICNEEYPAFCQLAKFVSCGTLQYIESLDDLIHLYKMADKYELLHLKESCTEYIENNITCDNASDILILADLHSDKNLKSTTLQFIQTFLSDVKLTESWTRLTTMHKDLAQEIDGIDNEIKITKQSLQTSEINRMNGVKGKTFHHEITDSEILCYYS